MSSIFNPASLPGARINPIHAPALDATAAAAMRGLLTTPAAVRAYIEAGAATLTVASIRTGTRYTYKFKRPDAKPGEPLHARPIWVSLLSGPDNETAYSFLGTCFPDVAKDAPVPVGTPFRYRHSKKTRIDASAPSVRALQWFLGTLYGTDPAPLAQAECWHEGRCGRCGRTLTVPASIASGFGPECIQHVNAPALARWTMPPGDTPNPAYSGPARLPTLPAYSRHPAEVDHD